MIKKPVRGIVLSENVGFKAKSILEVNRITI